MPSPLAHWTVGLLITRSLWPRVNDGRQGASAPWLWLIPVSLVVSLLPDIPSVIGLATGDFGRFHNSLEHSLVAGLGFAVLGGAVARMLGYGAWRWFLIVLLCFELHVVMDLLTVGRGVKVLWPFSEARYSPPIKLFYGLHWSDGWLTIKHLWTFLSEAVFCILVVGLAYGRAGSGRDASRRRSSRPVDL